MQNVCKKHDDDDNDVICGEQAFIMYKALIVNKKGTL